MEHRYKVGQYIQVKDNYKLNFIAIITNIADYRTNSNIYYEPININIDNFGTEYEPDYFCLGTYWDMKYVTILENMNIETLKVLYGK